MEHLFDGSTCYSIPLLSKYWGARPGLCLSVHKGSNVSARFFRPRQVALGWRSPSVDSLPLNGSVEPFLGRSYYCGGGCAGWPSAAEPQRNSLPLCLLLDHESRQPSRMHGQSIERSLYARTGLGLIQHTAAGGPGMREGKGVHNSPPILVALLSSIITPYRWQL